MKLQFIETAKIRPNPGNPRGIAIAEEDAKLSLLRDSIEQLGILVPVVVKPQGRHYLLIDGERRVVAAQQLGLKRVPAYVSQATLTDRDILMRMFHIHHNREQWGPIQQCNALEDLFKTISNRKKIAQLKDEDAKVKAIAAALEEQTGIEPRTALDRVMFLRWPRDVKQGLYRRPTEDYWYIVEIEKGIVLPGMKNYPEYFERVPVDDVRRDLFGKLKANSVRMATEVRVASPIVKFKTSKRSERKKVLKILDNLRADVHVTYHEAAEEFERTFPHATTVDPPSPRKLVSSMGKLCDQICAFDESAFSKNAATRRSQEREVRAAAAALAEAVAELRRHF